MFGQLVAALRKEHRDEKGYQWTQQILASEADIPPNAIGKIERGERSVQPDELVRLAAALQLTSSERREFFLAAAGVDNTDIAASQKAPAEVLDDLVDQMGQMCLPAYITDSYCDIVAANAAAARLLNISPGQIRAVMFDPFINANLLRFVFSPDFDYRPVMGKRWHNYAFKNMMNFRTLTLRYRATNYFDDLFHELQKWPLFRMYWHRVYNEERDHRDDDEYIQFNLPHSQGQKLTFIATSRTTVTYKGELYFNVYIPLQSATVQCLKTIVQEVGTTIYRMDNWPQKPVPVPA
jgi:transcriptional regulator with XRE-family HTH domain